ncbi:hypothetical protein GPALN_016357 [Globodera pallida]|nr:hypothetical protein GPALN_016357 [Globodera pallida]
MGRGRHFGRFDGGGRVLDQLSELFSHRHGLLQLDLCRFFVLRPFGLPQVVDVRLVAAARPTDLGRQFGALCSQFYWHGHLFGVGRDLGPIADPRRAPRRKSVDLRRMVLDDVEVDAGFLHLHETLRQRDRQTERRPSATTLRPSTIIIEL